MYGNDYPNAAVSDTESAEKIHNFAAKKSIYPL